MRPLQQAVRLHQKALLHLDQYLREGIPEELRRFRIALKRIRALLSIRPEDQRLWRKYRKIYRLSSPVRDADISGAATTTEAQAEVLLFRERAQVFLSKRQKLPRSIRRALRPLRYADVQDAVHRNGRILGDILRSAPAHAQWHELRKACKQMLYLARATDKKAAIPSELKTILRQVDRNIGQWHDHVVSRRKKEEVAMRTNVRKAMAPLMAWAQAGRSPLA